MVSKYTQHKQIWDYMCKHPEGITNMEGYEALRITKTSTRVGEMIQLGYPIKKMMESRIDESGITRYMRYWKAGELHAQQDS